MIPAAEKLQHHTVSECCLKVSFSVRVCRSQSFTVMSEEHVHIREQSGEKSRHHTFDRCSLKTDSSCASTKSITQSMF